jgi:urease accessory protein UreE
VDETLLLALDADEELLLKLDAEELDADDDTLLADDEDPADER